MLRRKEHAADQHRMRVMKKQQKRALAAEIAESQDLVDRNHAYGVELLDQIADKEYRKREGVNEKLEERKRLNLERRIENELLEKMKKDAIAEMENTRGIGIYWTRDITRVDVAATKVT